MSERAVDRPRLPVTAFIGASLFFTGVTYASTLPYGGIVAIDALGIANETYAIILTIAALVAGAVSVTLGLLSDKLRDRRLLVILCALLGALGNGLIYLQRDPTAFIIATCVILPFGGALFSQTFAYTRVYYNTHLPARAAFRITMLRTIFAVAWVLIPPVAGWIAATYAVFDVYAMASLAFLACGALFALLMADPATMIGTGSKTASSEPPARGIEMAMVIGILGVILVMIAARINAVVAPLAIVSNFGGTLTDVGIYAALAALLEIPCMVAWGFAAERFKKHWLIVASALVYGIYLFLLGQVQTVIEVYWLQILNAVATAGLLSIPISYVQEAIRGRVGLSTSLLDITYVVANLAGGALFGLTGTIGYLPQFGMAAALAVAGAIVVAIGHTAFARRVAVAG